MHCEMGSVKCVVRKERRKEMDDLMTTSSACYTFMCLKDEIQFNYRRAVGSRGWACQSG